MRETLLLPRRLLASLRAEGPRTARQHRPRGHGTACTLRMLPLGAGAGASLFLKVRSWDRRGGHKRQKKGGLPGTRVQDASAEADAERLTEQKPAFQWRAAQPPAGGDPAAISTSSTVDCVPPRRLLVCAGRRPHELGGCNPRFPFCRVRRRLLDRRTNGRQLRSVIMPDKSFAFY